jgi:tripartite ATP-independent transporter DctP family solute receptor
MKRFCEVFVFTVLLLAVFLSGVTEAAQITKVAISVNPDMSDPVYVMAVVFKNYVETRTGGRHVVEVYPSNVIGKERERLELVKAGGIQVNVGSIGGLSAIYKPGILLNTPFMYSSDKVVHAVLESDFVKWLFEDLYRKTGIRSYMIFDIGGLSCFTNSLRPITKVTDMKGIKFRAMDDSQIAMFRALGANAIPMAFAELYTGLQTGVVEGQVNPINLIISSKFYEVQKYISISRTILGSQWVTFNEKWYESFSPEDRKIFDDAFLYANIAATGQSQIIQATGIRILEDYKMQVSDISPEDYKEFQQLGRTAVLDWCKTQMEPEIVDRFTATVEEIEKKLQ